jgi:hypothetical protein
MLSITHTIHHERFAFASASVGANKENEHPNTKFVKKETRQRLLFGLNLL